MNNIKLVDINKLYDNLLNKVELSISIDEFNEVLNDAIVNDKINDARIDDKFGSIEERLYMLEPLKKQVKSLKNDLDNSRYNIDSLDKKIDNTLVPIDDLKNDIKSLNVFIFDEEGFPHHKSLRDDVNSIQKLQGNHEIYIKSINDNIETFNDIKCDIKDIKCDLEYKVHEDDLDDKISDSNVISDLDDKIITSDDIDDAINDSDALCDIKSELIIDYDELRERLKALETSLIKRVFNNVKRAFNTLLSVRLSIKTK